jgi:hypothetical protein
MDHASEKFSPAESAEITRRRRGRNQATALALLALCVLFYAVAVVKMAGHG